ncbi:hypothetical protein BH10PLA2_BH10PLA2_30230 [soil metagenome]
MVWRAEPQWTVSGLFHRPVVRDFLPVSCIYSAPAELRALSHRKSICHVDARRPGWRNCLSDFSSKPGWYYAYHRARELARVVGRSEGCAGARSSGAGPEPSIVRIPIRTKPSSAELRSIASFVVLAANDHKSVCFQCGGDSLPGDRLVTRGIAFARSLRAELRRICEKRGSILFALQPNTLGASSARTIER